MTRTQLVNRLKINESTVKINGALINKIGKSQNIYGDESKPGLVIKVI